MKKKKNVSVTMVVLLLALCITVGYSVITTTLNINGNAQINPVSWDVHFGTITPSGTSTITATEAPRKIDNTHIGFALGPATEPGKFYEFDAVITNGGSIDAKLDSAPTLTGVSATQDVYTNYTVKYSDGTAIQAGDILNAGQSKTVRVRFEFDKNVTAAQLPTETQEFNLSFGMTYVQK